MAFAYDYFVVFAEMRTGSNFLETNINAFDDLECFGEAFNPAFIGYPNKTDLRGVTKEDREKDPWAVLKAVQSDPKSLGGFRYFNDHDPRVLDSILNDPKCAKIILTRNPVESYVSLKIARETNQWKLTNVNKRKSISVSFDALEFEDHMASIQAFQVQLLNGLQKTGQTAFYVAYEDLQDVDVMNGLATFLGSSSKIEELDKSLKIQNPSSLSEKVENFAEMEVSLANIDRFNLTRTPNFEPRRGPAVPTMIAAETLPLLFMPLRSGLDGQVMNWMADIDPDAGNGLQTGFSQKLLRQWKKANPGHRSFTVLQHPLARAHAAFCDKILSTGEGSYIEIRRRLGKHYGMEFPESPDDSSYTIDQHRQLFLQFLEFLKQNLTGQTGIRIDPHWASQLSILQGMAQFMMPDVIIREEELSDQFDRLASHVGVPMAALRSASEHRFSIADIYDAELETAARDVYARDYMNFGFSDWA